MYIYIVRLRLIDMCSNTRFSYFSSLLFLLLIYFVLGPSACMYRLYGVLVQRFTCLFFHPHSKSFKLNPLYKKSFFFLFPFFFFSSCFMSIYNPLGYDRPNLKKTLPHR